MKNQAYNWKNWGDKFEQLRENATQITNEVNDYLLDYFKETFDVKRFGTDIWKPSKHNKNTLIDSGDLKKSIKTVHKNPQEILIESDTPYSAIHNYGGTIKITKKMRKFFWAKWYETKEDWWKGMALTNKTHIKIPQRTFIGVNNEMEQEIEKIIIDVITDYGKINK